MSLKQLVEAGCEVVGGIGYMRHKEVGRWHNGQFVTNDLGAAVLAELQAKAVIEDGVGDDNEASALEARAKKIREKEAKAAAKAKAEADAKAAADAAAAAALAAAVPGAPSDVSLPKSLQAELDAANQAMAALGALQLPQG